MNRFEGKKKVIRAYVIVSLIFVLLAISLGALMGYYWIYVLEPRLEAEAQAQSKFLAQTQAAVLAKTLSSEDDLDIQSVRDEIDNILILSDPASGSPFFLRVSLEMDYDVVNARQGTLDVMAGITLDEDFFTIEVPLYSSVSDELLGIAGFQVSAKFFNLLKKDVRKKLFVESAAVFALLFVVWLAILQLIRKLQLQITERERAEKALAEALQEQEVIMEAMPDIFYFFDLEGRIVRWNKKMEELSGLSGEEIKERHVSLFVPVEEREEIMEAFKVVFVKGINWIEGHMIDVKRGPVPYHFSGVAIKNLNGEITGLAGMGRDISDAKRAELEIKEYSRKLELSNKELNAFAHTASHDLQEPLRKINAYGDLLEEEYGDVVDEEGKKYIKSMQGAATRMQKLITALLSYSRIATKGEPFTSVDLNAVLEEALDDLQMLIKESGGKIEAEDLPIIEGDHVQMRQLLFNLVGNALKYRKEDQAPLVRVKATIEKGGPDGRENMCIISVEDKGIGFEQKYSEKIFTIFQRLHGRNEYEGTGIGLALCSKIVKRHGGTISADANPGEGATFTIKLPLKQIRGG